jgi:hypothetical protein
MTDRSHRWFVPLLVVALISCGYSSAPLYRYDSQNTTVSIPVFENRTNWRNLELDVTQNVVEKVTARTPFRLVDQEDADLLIRGEITEVSRPVLSEGNLDSVIRSSVRYTVNVKIKNRSTDEILQEETDTFSASFAQARGKSEEAARQEVQHDIGSWVVGMLQKKSW